MSRKLSLSFKSTTQTKIALQLCLFVLLTFPFQSLCSYKSDSLKFEELIAKANYQQSVLRQKDEIIPIYEEAIQYAKTPYHKAKLNGYWAYSLYFQGKISEAKKMIEKNFSEELIRSTGTKHSLVLAGSCNVMNMISKSGSYDIDGDFYLLKMIRILGEINYSGRLLIDAYNELGANSEFKGEINEAIKWYKKTDSLAIANNDIIRQMDATNNLAGMYARMNQMDRAREFLDYYKYLIDKNPKIPADPTHRASMVYYFYNQAANFNAAEKKYDSAIWNAKKSIEIVSPLAIKGSHRIVFDKATFLKQLSQAYGKNKMFEEAIETGLDAVGIFEGIVDKSEPFLIMLHQDICEYYIILERNSKAEKYLEMLNSLTRNNQFFLRRTHNLFGDYYQNLGMSELAKLHYDSTLRLGRLHRLQTIFIKDDYNPDIEAIFGLLKLGLENTDDLNKLFNQIVPIAQTTSINNPEVLSKLGKTLSLFHEKFLESSNKDNLWLIHELIKSVKLKSHLKDVYSLKYSLPDSLISNEKSLRDSINLQIGLLRPNQFDSTLFFLQRRYDQFTQLIRDEYPNYDKLKSGILDVDLEMLQSTLDEDEIALSFFEGDKRTYFLHIYSDSVAAFDIPKVYLDSLIDQFNKQLLSGMSTSDVGLKISEMLQLNIGDTRRISIIPDGSIWKLNFAVLPYSKKDSKDYLGNKVSLSYKYHGQDNFKEKPKANKEVLALSFNENEKDDNGFSASYAKLRDLNESIPGTSKEINAISDIVEGDYFYSSQASETRFKAQSDRYSILHLAIHGYQDALFPENSFLQFNSKDSINDGRLYAYELYNMRLNADLAVLSACNSGKGKIETGEGMMSMGRAFSYAGVNSLLASRWEVPDISSPYIMKYFYEGLKQGMSKSESLRYAQNKFLLNNADNITLAPFYWAGFYVIGNDDPIFYPFNIRRYTLVAVVICFIGIVFYNRKKLF